jgi:hypothetical protein
MRWGALMMHLPPLKPPTSFNGNMLLFVGCCAVAGFVGWPIIKGMMPGSFPQEQHGKPAFDQWGFTGDQKRVQRWSDGETPQQRGYSEYYPRDGRQAPAAPYRMDRHPGGEGDRDAPPMAGRQSPETTGRGRPAGCWDTRERRMVDPSFCDRAERGGRR